MYVHIYILLNLDTHYKLQNILGAQSYMCFYVTAAPVNRTILLVV
jgi:hypothetical protein